MSRIKRPVKTATQEFVEAAAKPHYPRAIADVDSQIVNAHSQWLHAAWEHDFERLEQAMLAIDMLLERRFRIMQAQAAEAA
jgi:hypothetical protein